ncbi:hypothetical protein ACFTZ8_15370 [Streptomyces fungicidicus]|jgi:hypothetical protein|uniref:Basic proline-rich protein n=1 Tax=Streptomyces griseoflavus Tu4000 TaxID=467200 RepID=D9XQH3_9ACTN|nr:MULTISPECIES: hypothetical protein [Streptomyces]EFL37546.1 basic proline-rich protein [Streptomyces griseoflavus Tu4000]TQL18449.1 hypothetical protein FBY37_0346 [Streptomyces sp. SLBN-134]
MLATVDRPTTLVALPTARGRRSRSAAAPVPAVRPAGAATDVLRIIADPRTPTYVTVHASGRRRYSYWRPLDSTTGAGGCYASLPTAECDALHEAGRITLGEPVVDPHRTTYRVSTAARVQPAPVRGTAREGSRVREASRREGFRVA